MIMRQINESELELVRNQRLICYEEYKSVISKEHWNALKGTLTNNDLKFGVEIFVAELNEKIVGSVVLFPAKTEAYEWVSAELEYPEIRMLAIDPHVRGQGLGKQLVQYCIRRTQENGYRHVGLHTAEFMKNAILLYTKLGFERVPELDFEPANDGIIVQAFKLSIPVSK